MSRSNAKPEAALHVRDLGDGAAEYQVDCRFGTTYIVWHPGGPITLARAQLALFAAYRHEELCGRCELGPVFAQGDQTIRKLVEVSWAAIQRERLKERAN